MPMLQQSLVSWIERHVPGKGTNYEATLPAIIATDTGLIRKENQDRAVVMRFVDRGRTQTVFALADGMGGMRNGAHCASLAVAAFLESYATNDELDIETRLQVSALYANKAVFSYSRGSGGATLSAVAVGSTDGMFHSVNVGDSRIFAFGENRVERLTVDDSLAEAVGGHGRELLQFVGMGEGMQPHVRQSSGLSSGFLITSDGVHFVHPEVFETVLSRSPSIKAAAERLMALARWSGGPDNATLIIANTKDLAGSSVEGGALYFWDSFSMLQIIFSENSTPPTTAKNVEKPPTSLALGDSPAQKDKVPLEIGSVAKKPKRRRSRDREDKVQLSISVEEFQKEGATDADR